MTQPDTTSRMLQGVADRILALSVEIAQGQTVASDDLRLEARRLLVKADDMDAGI
jgi:hypothetical protein